MTEADRVEQNIGGETPPPVEVRLVGRCGEPRRALGRLREVMKIVAAQRQDGGGWPADAWWREHLPPWFTNSFLGHTIEDIVNTPGLWDFESWLDAIKSPEWEWWSSCVEPDHWVVKLSAHSYPYVIGPLEYLARVAGTENVEVTEPAGG